MRCKALFEMPTILTLKPSVPPRWAHRCALSRFQRTRQAPIEPATQRANRDCYAGTGFPGSATTPALGRAGGRRSSRWRLSRVQAAWVARRLPPEAVAGSCSPTVRQHHLAAGRGHPWQIDAHLPVMGEGPQGCVTSTEQGRRWRPARRSACRNWRPGALFEVEAIAELPTLSAHETEAAERRTIPTGVGAGATRTATRLARPPSVKARSMSPDIPATTSRGSAVIARPDVVGYPRKASGGHPR